MIYATVRAFLQNNYFVAAYHYLTPFYSPCVSTGARRRPATSGRSSCPTCGGCPYAALSLPFLLLFRLTCYYYRGAYYRSVWQSPTACAVAEPHAKYTGETRLPLIIQNTHRYFFYIAGIISVINTYDAIEAFHSTVRRSDSVWATSILVVNVIMLWVYTLSCHSCRHVIGGRLKHFSKHPVRYWFWTQVSKLNTRHKHVRVDHAGHPDAHRLLHHAGRQRNHFRPEIHRLNDHSQADSQKASEVSWLSSNGTSTTWSSSVPAARACAR